MAELTTTIGKPLHLVALLLCVIFARGALADSAAQDDASLYARMGGGPVVTKVASDLVDQASKDERTRRTFDKVDLVRLKKHLSEQICVLAAGPCAYAGDDMKQAHAGMNITQAEFYGMVEELRAVLDRNNVGAREKNELLALLAPMKRDIVTH